jgi:hypothetical protein
MQAYSSLLQTATGFAELLPFGSQVKVTLWSTHALMAFMVEMQSG